jgi:hypothetical protein
MLSGGRFDELALPGVAKLDLQAVSWRRWFFSINKQKIDKITLKNLAVPVNHLISQLF